MLEATEQVCHVWDLSEAQRDTYWFGLWAAMAIKSTLWVIAGLVGLYILGAAGLWAHRQYSKKGEE